MMTAPKATAATEAGRRRHRNEWIVRLYEGGKTIGEISPIVGLSYSRVHGVLVQAKVPFRSVGRRDGHRGGAS